MRSLALRTSGPADPNFFRSSAMRAAMSGGRLVEPFRQHVVTYRACQVIAMNIAALHLTCWSGPPEDTDRQRVESAAAQAIERLLSRPNPHTRRHGFIYNTVVHLLTTGEGWFYLRDVQGNQLTNPLEIPRWIFQKNRRDVVLDRTTGKEPEFKDRDTRETLASVSNLQAKLEDPFDCYRGLAPMDVGGLEIETDWNAARYNNAFFENAAIPDGVISTPQALTDPQRSSLREQFEQKHRGVANAHRLAVLSHGMTFSRMGDSHREMEYINGRKFNREQFQILFGTPESELGVTKDTKFNNGITGNRGLWSQTLLPIMEIVESTLNDPDEGLAIRYDRTGKTFIGFDRSRVAQVMDEITEKLEQAERLWRMGVPLQEVNARLSLGLRLDQIDGTDRVFIDGGVQTLETAQAASEPADEETAAETKPKQPAAVYTAGAELYRGGRWENRAVMVRSIASEVDALWTTTERSMLPKINSWMREYRKAMLDKIDAEGRAAENTERASTDPSELRALDDLVFNRASKADQLLLDYNAWQAKLIAKMRKDYSKAVNSAAKTVKKELGGLQVYEIGHPAIKAFEKTLAKKVTRVEKTIRTKLMKQLAKGLQEGETVAQLKDRVRGVMNAAASRAKTIARTEAGAAINGGRYRVMKMEGVAGTEWSAMIDDVTRDTHIEINGEKRKLGKKFSNGLYYPHQTGAPAEEVVNCRCIAITLEAGEI